MATSSTAPASNPERGNNLTSCAEVRPRRVGWDIESVHRSQWCGRGFLCGRRRLQGPRLYGTKRNADIRTHPALCGDRVELGDGPFVISGAFSAAGNHVLGRYYADAVG